MRLVDYRWDFKLLSILTRSLVAQSGANRANHQTIG
jgi:hypothetical protein